MNIFQSKEWEEFKLATGYQKSYRINDILVLQKNLPLGRTMLYSPLVGSEAAGIMNNELGIREFSEQVSNLGKSNNSIFYRLELNVPIQDSKFKILNSAFGFAKSFEEMQPEHTLILNIASSEEEILSQMKEKGRYNIKIAQRSGLTLKTALSSGPELDDFYKLYQLTGKRHGITFRGKNYFATLLDILGKSDLAKLYLAYHEDTPVAGSIVVDSGDTAIYMFGASNNEFRNLMAPYLLHWQAILDAKAKNQIKYDFFGIAPDDNPGHPWAGVTRFKKQFGGHQVDILGSFDLIFKPLEYQIFKIAEKIRR